MNDPRSARACSQCGARLPARLGIIRCEYCGAETRFDPPKERQEYGPAVPLPDRPKAPRRSAAATWGWLSIAAVSLGISAYTSYITSRPPSDAATPGTGPASGFVQTVANKLTTTVAEAPKWRSQVCFLRDLDGDGVGELGGAIELDSVPDKHIPVRVNGATGVIEWRGEPFSRDKTRMLCLGEALLGVSDEAALAIDVYAVDVEAHFRRSLSDKLEYYGVGDDCISVRTADHQTVGLALAGGGETTCRASPKERAWGDPPSVECSIISTIDKPRKATDGARDFELRPRKPGTPFLTVRGLENRKELWKQTLRFIPVGGEAIGCIALTAAQGSVVTVGALRENEHELWLVGLDAATGIERFAHRQGPRSASRLQGFGYNQRFVIMGESWRDELVAFDPVDGTEAWRIGGSR